jgi:hypothetical protein
VPDLRRLLLVALLGGALAGCGGSSAHHQVPSTPAGQPTAPALPHPASSAGVAGNGSVGQAGTICRSFIDHVNRDLALGGLTPGIGPVIYSELEGLSRRLQFLGGAARSRAAVARWAADLDRAAVLANAMAVGNLASPAARSRFAAARRAERAALAKANRDAAGLGYRACHIAI